MQALWTSNFFNVLSALAILSPKCLMLFGTFQPSNSFSTHHVSWISFFWGTWRKFQKLKYFYYQESFFPRIFSNDPFSKLMLSCSEDFQEDIESIILRLCQDFSCIFRKMHQQSNAMNTTVWRSLFHHFFEDSCILHSGKPSKLDR